MPIPVITVAQMREWERATWASGQTEEAVMRLAGRAVGRRAGRLTRPGDLVLILAGKGHNGDDARFAGESEHLLGRQVLIIPVLDPESAMAEIATQLQRRPALIVDGLFGIGLNRPLSAPWLRLIRAINESGAPVLAVDVPSGLNADTGEPMNDAIQAAHTVTFGAVKEGMLKTGAATFIGSLEVANDIGLIPCPFKTEINYVVSYDFAQFPPLRPMNGHKGTFGHLAVIAGSLGYHGASVLAARGAQRAQPGLITLFTAENVYHPVAGQLQSVMVQPWKPEMTLPQSCTAVAIGPGLASTDLPRYIQELACRLWKESPLAVIVDASALEWLPQGRCPDKSVRVMTPHPGEAARLLKTSTTEIQNDRPKAVRQLSGQWGDCFVVLKGRQTITGRRGDALYVNSSGNPFLAQGGSGDLLTGYLGGLLAQPALQDDPGKTIRYAVWQHGATADALLTTRTNWTVEDMAGALGNYPRVVPS
jgi:NAD(P)H-hydrate epimerase